MQIPAAIEPLVGVWPGSGSLWLNPTDPPSATFDCRATVSAAAQANLMAIDYTWAFDDEPEEGLLLVGARENGELEASWFDSWHMNDAFMISRGRGGEQGRLSLLGAYRAPNGPDWGWRTVIEVFNSTHWTLRMYNIPPGGQDALAFEMRFRRS